MFSTRHRLTEANNAHPHRRHHTALSSGDSPFSLHLRRPPFSGPFCRMVEEHRCRAFTTPLGVTGGSDPDQATWQTRPWGSPSCRHPSLLPSAPPFCGSRLPASESASFCAGGRERQGEGVPVHEHKASGFILTLNEKLANYSSNLINMQTDICYLGVNSGALSWGRGTYVHLSSGATVR